ncbi:glutathione hydrolase 1 proenzyme-like [Amphiura filiformis]|uniref:glutathione hydrolase 1 proenzyme-like n=1 Tax=Amphiura filiformis TaxID=82378 RepID=UPI003B21D4D1
MFYHEVCLFILGGLSVAVPGELQGFYQLHQRAGRLPWKDLFTPSIQLAREGFPIGGGLYIAMDQNKDIILNDESLSDQLTDGNGNLLEEGDIIRFPELAATMETIANNGSSDAFYHGELAAMIAAEIHARGK